MKIHLVGIAGTAMGALAGLLKKEGHLVTGSDQAVYPPMSDVLKNLQIEFFEGYSASNIEKTNPDLVIIGNVISRPNPEAQKVIELEIPYLSFAEALRDFFIKEKTSVVVSGTHGKTTTTSMIAWLLEASGKNPSFFIGGVPGNFETGFRNTDGDFFVSEGDEYDTAFWLKVPKFIFYKPQEVILSSIEFDHADIYKNLDAVLRAFGMLMETIPEDGHLLACSDYETTRNLISGATPYAPPQCLVETFGCKNEFSPDFLVKVTREDSDGICFQILKKDVSHDYKLQGDFEMSLTGTFNALNAASALIQVHRLGIDWQTLASHLKKFKTVKRRQEVVFDQNGVLIIDDFAHHPTAVQATLTAIRKKYPAQKIWAVWEPRSATSRRSIFQKEYAEAFRGSDCTVIAKPYDQSKIAENERFSSEALVKSLNDSGVLAKQFDTSSEIASFLLKGIDHNDVILVMSNGGFDGLILKLKEGLS